MVVVYTKEVSVLLSIILEWLLKIGDFLHKHNILKTLFV